MYEADRHVKDNRCLQVRSKLQFSENVYTIFLQISVFYKVILAYGTNVSVCVRVCLQVPLIDFY
jgi:hypothetical protein